MSATMQFRTQDTEQTRALAAALGQACQGGEVVGLVGDLGAGKTCFVQGLALGLGVPKEAYVTSPTFVLIATHRGRVLLHHVDLYRLGDPEEAALVGFDDLFDGQAVVAVEWFDRFPALWPRGYLQVTLAEAGVAQAPPRDLAWSGEDAAMDAWDRPRRITATARGPAHSALLARWRKQAPKTFLLAPRSAADTPTSPHSR